MPDFSPLSLRAKPAKREVAMNAFRARQQAKGRIDLLPPEPKTPAKKPRSQARCEVVDVDFVVIRTGPARTSNDNHRPIRPVPLGPAPRHLLVRAGAAGARLCEAGLQLLSDRAFASLVTASFIFVFAYAGGLSALKAALPTTEPGAALRVADVTATVDDQNGMKVLSVYGRVENVSESVEAAPPVDILVEGAAETPRRVALDSKTIAAGGSENFALRIPHSGGKVPKVAVSLVPEGAPVN